MATSALPSAVSAVAFDPRSETVTMPGGVVSMAGITLVTGGVELSCGSCLMAFGIWGTLIGLSVVALGLWHQSNLSEGRASHLLELGWAILAVGFGMVGSVVGYHLLTKTKRESGRRDREEGLVVLVQEGERVIKTVTV